MVNLSEAVLELYRMRSALMAEEFVLALVEGADDGRLDDGDWENAHQVIPVPKKEKPAEPFYELGRSARHRDLAKMGLIYQNDEPTATDEAGQMAQLEKPITEPSHHGWFRWHEGHTHSDFSLPQRERQYDMGDPSAEADDVATPPGVWKVHFIDKRSAAQNYRYHNAILASMRPGDKIEPSGRYHQTMMELALDAASRPDDEQILDPTKGNVTADATRSQARWARFAWREEAVPLRQKDHDARWERIKAQKRTSNATTEPRSVFGGTGRGFVRTLTNMGTGVVKGAISAPMSLAGKVMSGLDRVIGASPFINNKPVKPHEYGDEED